MMVQKLLVAVELPLTELARHLHSSSVLVSSVRRQRSEGLELPARSLAAIRTLEAPLLLLELLDVGLLLLVLGIDRGLGVGVEAGRGGGSLKRLCWRGSSGGVENAPASVVMDPRRATSASA